MAPSELGLIKEAIAGVKKTLGRDKFRLDLNDEAPKATNRGNKLKRGASLFHEGRIGGQRPYKKRIQHAGHHRYIVHENPLRYDEDGYELSDDADDADADEDVAEGNPYSQIAIETLLMPLTAASELQNHPTLSIPYKSSIIPGMVEQACGMVHKERKSLVDLKLLLTIFRGDHGWIPCGSLHTDGDLSLFPTDTLPVEPSDQHVEQATGSVEVVLEADNVCVKDIGLKKEPDGPENEPLSILDGVREPFASGNHQPGAQREEREARTCETEPKEHLVQEEPPVLQESKGLGVVVTTKILGKDSTERIAEEEGATVKGRRIDTSADDAAPTQKDDGTIQSPSPLEDDKTDKGSRMLTRGQAQAQASAASNTPRHESRSSPSLSSEPPLTIHPLYLPPANAIPSRNHGLPENEADDMRKILSALVQKQEEVVRGAEQMYEGLLKAQRLMRTVWRWCKAEAHVGEMSDGEDWVDAEEWGLDGPLKKGQEEVEDTTERRPRGRRTAQ